MIEIQSNLPFTKALEAIKKNTFKKYIDVEGEGLVGIVSKEKVYLYRGVPLSSNAFLPVFSGRLVEIDGSTVLRGDWSFHHNLKIFLTLLIIFILIDIIANKFSVSSIIFSVTVLATFWGSFQITKGWSSKDKQWIINAIEILLNPIE